MNPPLQVSESRPQRIVANDEYGPHVQTLGVLPLGETHVNGLDRFDPIECEGLIKPSAAEILRVNQILVLIAHHDQVTLQAALHERRRVKEGVQKADLVQHEDDGEGNSGDSREQPDLLMSQLKPRKWDAFEHGSPFRGLRFNHRGDLAVDQARGCVAIIETYFHFHHSPIRKRLGIRWRHIFFGYLGSDGIDLSM